jgi:hypothetical protein
MSPALRVDGPFPVRPALRRRASSHLTISIGALELWAMAAPTEGAPRKVTEMEPVAVFIRHLVWGPLVFHAGMTNDESPTLKEQCAEILPRAGARLKENGWSSDSAMLSQLPCLGV